MNESSAGKLLKEWVITQSRRDGGDEVREDSLLMEQEILDSLGMMSLISYVETLLGREIPDDLMSFDNFESIQRIQRVFFSGESA